MQTRILARLDALDVASRPADMDLPGYDFHRVDGFSPDRYTMHVNGPWCITVRLDGPDVVQVELEQYH